MDAAEALLTTSALHAGFQAVVTVVVYPALADTPAEAWPVAHAAHSRRISVVVGPLYLLLAAANLWVLVDGPHSAAALVAVAGNLLAGLTTAAVAAPTHRRLGREVPQPALLHRLLVADRVRLAGALVAVTAAGLAVGG